MALFRPGREGSARRHQGWKGMWWQGSDSDPHMKSSIPTLWAISSPLVEEGCSKHQGVWGDTRLAISTLSTGVWRFCIRFKSAEGTLGHPKSAQGTIWCQESNVGVCFSPSRISQALGDTFDSCHPSPMTLWPKKSAFFYFHELALYHVC